MPTQESVWDYPRPPRVEDVKSPIRVVFNGVTIAETTRAQRVLESSHPPVYYIPPEEIAMEYLQRVPKAQSWCEWKGSAIYYDVQVGDRRAERAAWAYPEPTPGFVSITGYVAFYAGKMDACYVGDEKVEPQPGSFYGGWITSNIVGPFKGGPGTLGW